MKNCKACKIEFKATGGNQQYCKPCGEIRSKEVLRAGWRRGHRRKKYEKYGYTEEAYNKMFEKQKGQCDICGKHQTSLSISLAVDHCHNSNKIRGLLCRDCNLMLGFARDRIETLTKAIEYLERKKDVD